MQGNLLLALHFQYPKVIDWSADKSKKPVEFYVPKTERSPKSEQYDSDSPWCFCLESRSSGLAFPKSYIRETTMTCAPDLASPGGCRKGFGGSKGAVPYSTNPEQDPRPSAAVPCTAEHPPQVYTSGPTLKRSSAPARVT